MSLKLTAVPCRGHCRSPVTVLGCCARLPAHPAGVRVGEADLGGVELLLGAALLLLLCDGHGLREGRGGTGQTCGLTWWTVLHTTIEFLSQYVSSQLGPEHSESQICNMRVNVI